jgi:cell division protein FtsQ
MIWQQPRVMLWLSNLLFAVALALVLASVLRWVTQRQQFALWMVEVSAVEGGQLRRVSESTLRQVDAKRLAGSFFTTDLQAVRDEFAKLPWVRQVQVRRLWPNRLAVSLEEHQVLGTWSGGRLVNTYGEVFVANLAQAQSDGKLPLLEGPAGSEQLVAQRWAELNKWLEPMKVKPVSLVLSNRHAWTAQLASGTTLLLGRDQAGDHQERVARMVDVLPQVAAKLGEKPAQIDLRYPNGFAVRAGAQLAAWEKEQQRLRAPAQVPPANAAIIKDNDNKDTVKTTLKGDRG